MPKNTSQRIIDNRTNRTGVVFAGGTGGGGGGVTDHGALTGLSDDDHGQYHNDARGDARYVPLSRTVTAGTGLTGGGALSSDITLTPVAPATLTVSTTNSAASHTHAITTSSNPGANAYILASTVAGALTLEGLTVNGEPVAAGTAASYQFDDRAATGAGSRWAVYADNGTMYLYRPSVNMWGFGASGGLSTVSHLTLVPNDDLILDPGSNIIKATTGTLLQSNTFVSGFAGAGWRIDDGVSRTGYTTAEVDDLTVRGILRVYELLIHKIRTGNGSYLFANGGKVASVSGSGPYTLTFDEDHGLDVNDVLRAQKFTGSGTYQSNCTVTSVTDTKVLVVTLNSGNAPAAGYEYVRLGNSSDTSRQGGVYVTADDSNAPYIDIYDGVTSHATFGAASKTKGRYGKLSGITGTAGEYGLIAGVLGSAVATDDKYIRASNTGVSLRNVDLALYNGTNRTVYFSATGNDFYIGASTSDRRLTWDGTTLAIKGQATVRGGSAVSPGGVAGLYLGSDRMGYYDATNWKTSIDSSGNFTFLGSGSTSYIQWVAASNKLSGVSSSTERWKLEPSGMTFLESTDGSGTASLTWRSNALAEKSRMGYASSLDEMFWNLSVPLTITGTISAAKINTLDIGTRLHTSSYGNYTNMGYTQWHTYFYLNAYPNDAGTYAQATTGYSGKGRGIQLGDDIKFLRNASGGGIGSTVTPTAQLTIDDNGNVYTPDADVYGSFGPARVGYTAFSDTATFAHRDNTSTANYSIAQNSSGKTVVNSASGQTIDFRINNTNVASAAGTYVEFVQAVISDKYIEWAGTPYSSTDGPGGEFGKIRIFLRDAGTGKYELRWVSKNTANTATRGGVIFDTTEGADIP